MGADEREQRLAALQAGVTALQRRVVAALGNGGMPTGNAMSDVQRRNLVGDEFLAEHGRILVHAWAHGMPSSVMFHVNPAYYSWSLDERRQTLGAAEKGQLCKTIVMENTKHNGEEGNVCNARYYMIVIQYTTRLNTQKIMNYVKEMAMVSKKYASFRLADEEVSQKLSGFGHNAVTPVLSQYDFPIIVSKRIVDDCKDSMFFMGGGHVDLKLGVRVHEFLDYFKGRVFVTDVTYDGTIDDE